MTRWPILKKVQSLSEWVHQISKIGSKSTGCGMTPIKSILPNFLKYIIIWIGEGPIKSIYKNRRRNWYPRGPMAKLLGSSGFNKVFMVSCGAHIKNYSNKNFEQESPILSLYLLASSSLSCPFFIQLYKWENKVREIRKNEI